MRLSPPEDRFYRVSDELLKHGKAIETRLRGKSQALLSLNRSVILYAVNDTHFEGVCVKNPKAKHGKNKPQPSTENGFALARRALPVAGLKPVVSLDAGFASQQNLTRLRELGCSYLINLTRGSRQNDGAKFSPARRAGRGPHSHHRGYR